MREDQEELAYDDDIQIEEPSYKFNQPEQPKTSIGKVIGLLIILLSIGGVTANEFLSGSEEIPTIRAEIAQSENNNKLVYLTGELGSTELTDPMFQISSKGLALERVVEMYQWVEENGQYVKKWENKLIDISSEEAKAKGYVNPPEMPFSSDKWQIDEVKAGIFSLSPNLAKQAMMPEPLPLTNDDFKKLDAEGQAAFKLHNGTYFFGIDPENPRVGDLKISFMRSSGGIATVLAQQRGGSLLPYENNGTVVEKLFVGEKSLEAMSQGLELGGRGIVKWLIRIGGILMAILGLVVMLKSKAKAKPMQKSQKPQMAKFEYPMSKSAIKKEKKEKKEKEKKNTKKEEVSKGKKDEVDEPFEDATFDEEYEEEEDLIPEPITPSINKRKAPEKALNAIPPVAAALATAPMLEETIQELSESPEYAPPPPINEEPEDNGFTQGSLDLPKIEEHKNNLPEPLAMEGYAENNEEDFEELPDNIEMIGDEEEEEFTVDDLPKPSFEDHFEVVQDIDVEGDYTPPAGHSGFGMPAGIEMVGPDGVIQPFEEEEFPEHFEDDVEDNPNGEYADIPQSVEFIGSEEPMEAAAGVVPNLPPPLEFEPSVSEPEFIHEPEEEEIPATPAKVPPLPPPPLFAKKKAEPKLPEPPSTGFDLPNIPDNFDPNEDMAESDFDPFAEDDEEHSPFDFDKK